MSRRPGPSGHLVNHPSGTLCANPFPASRVWPPPSCRRRRSARAAAAGFTVLETVIAGALLTLFLSSVFVLNGMALRILRSGSETASASQCLQSRVEQIRLSNWSQVTDPAQLKTEVFSTATDASLGLPGLTETLAVAPYVAPGGAASTAGFTLERDARGQVTQTAGGGADLSDHDLVQFTITLRWASWGGRPRQREIVTIISPWGINR